MVKHIVILIFCLMVSCGTAIEESTDCRSYIENESWDEAITCFENGDYTETPATDLEAKEYLYLLHWAGSYGGKYGLVGSQIIEGALGEGGNDPIDVTSKTNALVAAGTLAVGIADMQKAIGLIEAYPAALRSVDGEEAVYFAKEIGLIGLIFTSFLADMQKRDFEIALDAEDLTTEELIEKADAVIETLRNGGEVVGDEELAAAINEQLSQIDSQQGSNTAEKLDEFIQSQ